MTTRQSLLFVFGLGYSALQLSARLKPAGWAVAGTVRTPAKAAGLQAQGIDAQVWAGEGAPRVPPGAHWLVTLPPDRMGCPGARAAGAVAKDAASITYLSTTGVYGDLKGGWAFEGSPLNPGSPRAAARVRAEIQWRGASEGRARLVRLPGIYGPGRSPFDRLRDGTAQRVIKPGQVFSRVHVDDIAGGLAALLSQPAASGVFHLCDDLPAPPQDVTAFAARLLGLPVPPDVAIGEAGLSEMALSFYAECKRVSNARAKAALGWRPEYPTYREGLAAILDAEGTQRSGT
ncbi:MAG: SDR family oxidoreductase [Hyphomonas sp.]|uniref:SDR family oxidoreductase n=1 Tax=Hyphomonas sp. TaxID=87 RepID=UPI0018223CCD|nr:SDR family oxidoreductase [Hyphomonas sp.]MBA3069391.1 SDR family oxidoreductase [Hyphomonas sp.]MBU3922242.1 SDR family oxidoreductase [Alphaproteobacteria bacterium]MBU4063773.1 SDR family oxidoreductase [Alphaproteobacteria bacterium]MBU4164266.1 SDR family oxidoreductase [Alphaproteobacteria bacterium]